MSGLKRRSSSQGSMTWSRGRARSSKRASSTARTGEGVEIVREATEPSLYFRGEFIGLLRRVVLLMLEPHRRPDRRGIDCHVS